MNGKSGESLLLPAAEETWWYCKNCGSTFWDVVLTNLCNKCNSNNIIRNKLLSINEVVERLEVKHSAIYEYIYSGKLKAHRLGGDGGKHRLSRKPYRVWEVDLLEFIDAGKFTLPKRKTGAKKADTESKENIKRQGSRSSLAPV